MFNLPFQRLLDSAAFVSLLTSIMDEFQYTSDYLPFHGFSPFLQLGSLLSSYRNALSVVDLTIEEGAKSNSTLPHSSYKPILDFLRLFFL